MTLRLTTLLAADKTTKRGDRRIGGSATRHGTSKAELGGHTTLSRWNHDPASVVYIKRTQNNADCKTKKSIFVTSPHYTALTL